jgi:hypothetical protein
MRIFFEKYKTSSKLCECSVTLSVDTGRTIPFPRLRSLRVLYSISPNYTPRPIPYCQEQYFETDQRFHNQAPRLRPERVRAMPLTPAHLARGLLRLGRRNWPAVTHQGVDLLSLHVDFRGISDDPFEARQRAPKLRHLLDLPFTRLRDMHPIVPDWPSNPFVLTAQALLENDTLTYRDSALCSYFTHVAPQNAAIVAGGSAPRLKAMKGIEADLPWKPFGAPALRLKHERSVRQARENNVVLSFEDGDYAMGPVSAAKGELEFARVRQVLRSIIEKGYCPADIHHHMNGYLMEDGQNWAVMLDSGTHRAACLYALGHTTLPILIKTERTVNRLDVAAWSNVKDQLLTKKEALALFDRILRGDDPDWLEGCWPQGVRQTAQTDAETARPA